MDTLAQFEYLLGFFCPGKQPGGETLSTEDWRGIVELSLAHGVGAILLHRLEAGGEFESVPVEQRQRLHSEKLRVAIQNTMLYAELAVVLNTCRAADISVVVLKGAHLAELVYPDVSLRPMDDIDLLVKSEDLNGVNRVLSELGYEQLDSDAGRMKTHDPHHLTPFRKEGCTPIEIHWTLPSFDAARIEELWGRTRPAEIAGSAALTLSPEDLLVHLSVHASLHHRFGVGLRPLCDVAAVIARSGDAMDWETLYRNSLRWKTQTALYLTLLMAKEMVGAPAPEHALQLMKPQHFDPALIAWAREQIRSRSTEIFDASAMSPRLAQFWTNSSVTEKCRQVLRAVFPGRSELARAQNSASGGSALFAYLRHWNHLLMSRSNVLWRLLVRDKNTVARAAMYRKLMDG